MDVAYRSAARIASDIATGTLSSREALDRLLERVGGLNPKLNAVVAVDVERARVDAAAADDAVAAGDHVGPLHGVPMTIKDSFEVAGMPATSGAPKYRDHIPDVDAVAVARLRAAGAVIFGKTNVPLFAGDLQTYNEVYGTTGNPWDTDRTPGGSSGGAAAALAAGLTPLELGTDIGGSIRNPAHYTGVFGHKTSHGVVPMRGHIPGPPGMLSRADIAVAGPLARTVEDLELALEVVAGPDRWDARGWELRLPPPRHDDAAGFRVAAWLDDPACPISADVAGVIDDAVAGLERTGMSVDRRARPDIDTTASHDLFLHLLYGVIGTGFPKPLLELFDAMQIDPDERSIPAAIARGASQRHREWLSRNEARQRLRAAWDAFFRQYDVVIMPVMPTPAFLHDHSDIASRTINVDGFELPYLQQTFWAGLAGVVLLPATSVPAGRSTSGLPVGLQVVGPYLEDRTTLAFARLIGDVTEGFVAPPGF